MSARNLDRGTAVRVAVPLAEMGLFTKLSATLFISLSLAGFAFIVLPRPANPLLIGVALTVIFLAGVAVIAALMHRLQALRGAMESFKRSNFKEKVPFSPSAANDEIDDLGGIYNEMAERMLAQLRDLREGDALRRDLIANVSHDLRTPLASLRGYVETLLVKNGSLTPEERRSYLEIAARQSEHLGVLVSELFELAKLEYENLKINREPILLPELAQDVLQKFELAANNKQIRLRLDTPARIPFASADVSLMERALENLIGNAVKYSPAGGEVRVAIAARDENLAVEVHDSGAGIPEQDLPFIFDRFYRVDKTRASSGAGLGLAITRRIIELHGSEISVTSSPTGACFSFTLPALRSTHDWQNKTQ